MGRKVSRDKDKRVTQLSLRNGLSEDRNLSQDLMNQRSCSCKYLTKAIAGREIAGAKALN